MLYWIFMAELSIWLGLIGNPPPRKKKTVRVIIGIEELQWLYWYIRVKLKLLSFFRFLFFFSYHFYLSPFLFSFPSFLLPSPLPLFFLSLPFLSPRGFWYKPGIDNHCSSFTGPISVIRTVIYVVLYSSKSC